MTTMMMSGGTATAAPATSVMNHQHRAHHQHQSKYCTTSSWTETAHEWYHRSLLLSRCGGFANGFGDGGAAAAAAPSDPSSAAWSFARPGGSTASGGGGTGITFVDAVLFRRHQQQLQLQYASSTAGERQQQQQHQQQLPVIDIRGASSSVSGCSGSRGRHCGKTWTIMTLAARFVVATRPSQFAANDGGGGGGGEGDNPRAPSLAGAPPAPSSAPPPSRRRRQLPQVVLFDSSHDVTIDKLAYVVRSALLRAQSSSSGHGERGGDNDDDDAKRRFEEDMACCLGRIHVARPGHDAGDWVAVLECVRCHLEPFAGLHPTLVLWDNFLADCSGCKSDEGTRMDVIRQVVLLLRECTVLFVSTTAAGGGDWEKHVTDRIWLERCPNHEYVATVHGSSRIPYSISLAGILS